MLFSTQRIERLYRWTLGRCWHLIKYSTALCIETLYLTRLIFRCGLYSALASSMWMWTILASMARQRNWLICPQTCKLLAFNPEEFLTLPHLFLSSLCFYHHLLSGQARKTPIFENLWALSSQAATTEMSKCSELLIVKLGRQWRVLARCPSRLKSLEALPRHSFFWPEMQILPLKV